MTKQQALRCEAVSSGALRGGESRGVAVSRDVLRCDVEWSGAERRVALRGGE
jgi:hypothetical protein